MARSASGSSILLSYDVPCDLRSVAARVSHVIFGRGDERVGAPAPFIERPGVVWLGQSVLLMPPALAAELARRLESLGAHVAVVRVSINAEEVDAFQRRMRRHARP